MICSIISGSAAGLAVIATIWAVVTPHTRGFAGLDDALLRTAIIGTLSTICCIASIFGLALAEPYKIYLIIMLCLSVLPSIAFLLFLVMILIKMM